MMFFFLFFSLAVDNVGASRIDPMLYLMSGDTFPRPVPSTKVSVLK